MTALLRIDDAQRRARLISRHGLDRSGRDPVDVADRLVALHSTDPASVYLALQARIPAFAFDDFERAAYDDRTLVRMLGMRRTVFVVSPSCADVVNAGCTAAIAATERRRIEKLVASQGHTDDPRPWLDEIGDKVLAHLDEVGDAPARDLSAAIPELAIKLHQAIGKPYAGTIGLGSQLLFLLSAEGRLARTRPLGTWISSQYRWARTEQWLGRPFAPMAPDEARAELARRWLGAFGPATQDDLQWWAGWTKGSTKAALAAIGAVEVALEGGTTGFVLADDLDPVEPAAPVAALLPTLDPTTMGWKARGWYLGEHGGRLFDRNGNGGPTIWWDGRVVGGWAQRSDGQVAVELLEPVTREARAAIDVEVERLRGWLGEHRVTSRFATPLERELLA